MPIKTSGTITIQDIVNEFGGTAPYSLSQYYRGGGRVPNGPSANANIAVSGSISLNQFYGAVNELLISLVGTVTNYNLYNDVVSKFGTPTGSVPVRLIIPSGATVGSTSSSIPALDVGQFPAGSTITIENAGSILGAGGLANSGVGGNAIKANYSNQTVTITNTGNIFGGGGGGGQGGKGGNGSVGVYSDLTVSSVTQLQALFPLAPGPSSYPQSDPYLWQMAAGDGFATGSGYTYPRSYLSPDVNNYGTEVFASLNGFFYSNGLMDMTQNPTITGSNGVVYLRSANPISGSVYGVIQKTPNSAWSEISNGKGYDYRCNIPVSYGTVTINQQTTIGTDGGAGGRGQGYNHGNAAGTVGSTPPTNAGRGGTGGSGGAYGNSGGTGQTGANGTVTNGLTGSAGGLAGSYLVRGSASVTFNNSGSIAGRLL